MVFSACAPGGTERAAEPGDDLEPAFPAVTETTVGTGEVVTTPAATTPAGSAATTVAAEPRPAGGGDAPLTPVTATIADRVGDATPSPLDRPPAWADLAGATLTRTADGFELRVRLGGGQAPATTDADHTMNVASFYDVDGDGTIDYEVWANLSSGGWGGSWFDNTEGTARYNDDAGVTWTPEGDSIVLRFPLSHLGNAATFRWSLASEWGRYEVLTTPASVRDDAPDNDRPAAFNG